MPQNGCSDLLYDLAIKFLTYSATSVEVARIEIAMSLVRKQPWASLPCWMEYLWQRRGFQNPTPDQIISELCSSHNSSTTALDFDLKSEMQVHVLCKTVDCSRSRTHCIQSSVSQYASCLRSCFQWWLQKCSSDEKSCHSTILSTSHWLTRLCWCSGVPCALGNAQDPHPAGQTETGRVRRKNRLFWRAGWGDTSL